MKPEFIKVLSEEEILQIHRGSIQILEKTGVSVHNPKLLKILGDAGGKINQGGNAVRFPESMVENLLKQAPKKIPLYSRGSLNPFEIGNGYTYSISGFDAPFLLDHDTGERHPITRDEVGNFAWISDQLENIDMVGVPGIPQNVPQELAEAHAVAVMLENTSKHLIIAPDTGRVAKIVYRMIEAVSEKEEIGLKPVVSCHISPSAPLRWTPNASDVILETVPRGIPFLILPAPMAGATSPVTLAGHLVVHNTEVLSGLVIAQIVREGSPVVYCNAHTIFNMREGNPIIATPETLLLRVAGAQMARHYNIPSHSIGFDADSHIVDQQGAWEKALTALVCVQAGVDLMVNLGMFSTGLTVSYAQLLLDHEVFGFLRRYQRGIDFSDEHLAVDLIQKVGTWGAYLEIEHTLKYFKKENWYPEISCRKLYEAWEKDGKRDALATAQSKAKKILEKPRVAYIDKKTRDYIQKELLKV